MEYEDEVLMDKLLNQHFYLLSTNFERLRGKYSHCAALIDQQLLQYATNVNHLCALASGTSPESWYGQLMEVGNLGPLQVSSVTNCDRTEPLLRSEATAMAQQDQASGFASQNWTSAEDQHARYTESSHELIHTDTDAHTERTVDQLLYTNSLDHEGTGMSFESCILQRPTSHRVPSLCQPLTPAWSCNFVQSNTPNDAAEQCSPQHTVSQVATGAFFGQRQRLQATANVEICDASAEAMVVQTHAVNKLNFTICSTEFLTNLRSLMYALRASHNCEIDLKSDDVVHISQAIDQLEGGHQVGAIRRRILLTRFAVHRERITEQITQCREAEPRRVMRVGTRSIESEVLDSLLMQIHPAGVEIQPEGSISAWRLEHKSKRKEIKNRCDAAKNWRQAVLRYGIGILGLLPSDGRAEWRNHKFETLPNAQRDALFEAWDYANGGILKEVASKLECIVQGLLAGTSVTVKFRLETTETADEVNTLSIKRMLEAI